jgi:hypothetical protein
MAETVLTCKHCGKQNPAVTFRDTAFLILGSAMFGNENAEHQWPIVCDGCWQRFREKFHSITGTFKLDGRVKRLAVDDQCLDE